MRKETEEVGFRERKRHGEREWGVEKKRPFE